MLSLLSPWVLLFSSFYWFLFVRLLSLIFSVVFKYQFLLFEILFGGRAEPRGMDMGHPRNCSQDLLAADMHKQPS